jgi:hypothetical protein
VTGSPDSVSNYRQDTFTMPSDVRLPTVYAFASPLRLTLSPRVPARRQAGTLTRFPVSRLCHCASESVPCSRWFRDSGSQATHSK